MFLVLFFFTGDGQPKGTLLGMVCIIINFRFSISYGLQVFAYCILHASSYRPVNTAATERRGRTEGLLDERRMLLSGRDRDVIRGR